MGGRPKYTADDAINAINAWVKEHGHVPTFSDWHDGHERPAVTVLVRLFGSWSEALTAAGHKTRRIGSMEDLEAEQLADETRGP